MLNKIFNTDSFNNDTATLLLRLIFGGLFLYFGITKLMMFDQLYHNFADPIGIGPKLSFILVLFAEVICAFFILIGFLTRPSVIPIFIVMVVVYFIVHAKDPFQEKILAFLLLLLCVLVFITGSGRYSVDRLISKKRVT